MCKGVLKLLVCSLNKKNKKEAYYANALSSTWLDETQMLPKHY